MKRAETQRRILRPSLSITRAAATVEITLRRRNITLSENNPVNINLDNSDDDIGVN